MMLRIWKRPVMSFGAVCLAVSACGTVNVPSKPKDKSGPTEEGCPGGDGGVSVAAPSVVGKSYSLNTFYASFIPPNRNIVETVRFGVDGMAHYSKSIIDGNKITHTEKTVVFTQNDSCLLVGAFDDSSPQAMVAFQVAIDGGSIVHRASKAVFKQDNVEIQAQKRQ